MVIVMDGSKDGLAAVPHPQSAVDAVKVSLDSSSADGEPVGHFGSCKPPHQEQQDVRLPGGDAQLPHQVRSAGLTITLHVKGIQTRIRVCDQPNAH
jgi:hypothetical protein